MARLGNVFSLLPWGCRFSLAVGCSPGAPELPEEPQRQLLHSWKSPCSRICPHPAPPPFPPRTQALEEPVWALRAELLPFPTPPTCLTGRAGRAQQKGRSLTLCCGGVWRFLLPVSQAWCHGAGAVLGPWPVPSSAATGTLVRELASSVSSLSDLCFNHCCGAAQLCRCNQDHDGVL